jgi:osmotically inducible protein OsmC
MLLLHSKIVNLSKFKIIIMKRNATAVWTGSLKEGSGKISTQSTVLNNTQYSFKSRFEEKVRHKSRRVDCSSTLRCFTMQLSAYISTG